MKIIISGGGTGGHIYPAIAIADALKKREPLIDILFVGAQGRMEMEKVPEAGYPIKGLWISGLQRKLTLSNLLFPVKVVHSMIAVQIDYEIISTGCGGWCWRICFRTIGKGRFTNGNSFGVAGTE